VVAMGLVGTQAQQVSLSPLEFVIGFRALAVDDEQRGQDRSCGQAWSW
jgi:hypothetical protein